MDKKSLAEYRQEVSYDAMGDYSVFAQKDSQDEEALECQTKEEPVDQESEILTV